MEIDRVLTSSADKIKDALIQHCRSKYCCVVDGVDPQMTSVLLQTRVELYRSVALARRVDGTASNCFYTLDDVVASRSKLTSGSANGCTAVVAEWLRRCL